MQFIINKSVVLNAVEQNHDIALDILVTLGLGKDVDAVRKNMVAQLEGFRNTTEYLDQFQNFNIKEVDGNIVVTLNDDIVRRYMGMTAKIVRALLPIAVLAKSAFGVLKHSTTDFMEWITAAKEEVKQPEDDGPRTVNGSTVTSLETSLTYAAGRVYHGVVSGPAVVSAFGNDVVRMTWDANGMNGMHHGETSLQGFDLVPGFLVADWSNANDVAM
jgi:hypothetical protein